ncbi:MAG: hypothetical protein KC448_15075 [Yoonia sp.]|nr:hypothetical protein [Yoonia sp.]
MSDPVTNVEIEDVLSSIRRLVAEGDKTRGPVVPLKNTDPAPVAQPERFVLTPALRVAETPTQETEEPIILSPESEALAAQFVAPAPEPLILHSVAEVEELLVHDAMSASERASLEATIAELEAAVTDESNEWEPDGSETTGPSALAEAFADLGADPGADVVIEHSDIEEVPEDEAESAADVVSLREPTPEPVLTFRHAALDDPEADYGDDLMEADDDGMPIPDDLDESIAAYLAGGTKMDDAAMRAMIVDVVRQELQGEMGDRITRNVRKLVRREINNALSSKSFT